MNIVLSIFIVIAALVLGACGGSSKTIESHKTHYFFGNSITLGTGVSDDESFVAEYAKRLVATNTVTRIDRLPTPNATNSGISDATLPGKAVFVGGTGPKVTVIRDGGGGRPIVAANGAGLLRDYVLTVQMSKPIDVLVIEAGINDAIDDPAKHVTPEQFKINLTNLVILAKRDAPKVYLMAPTYVSVTVQPVVQPYVAAIRQVAIEHGVGLIEPPTSEAWYGTDIYHPNAQGYAAIGKSVYDALL